MLCTIESRGEMHCNGTNGGKLVLCTEIRATGIGASNWQCYCKSRIKIHPEICLLSVDLFQRLDFGQERARLIVTFEL